VRPESRTCRGASSAAPPGRNSKAPIPYNKARYRERCLLQNAFCRLQDVRRIATRYDKLAEHFLSAALAIGIAFWIWSTLNPGHHPDDFSYHF
jgi:transposase